MTFYESRRIILFDVNFQVRLLSQPLPYVTNCSDSWERTWYNDYVNSAFPYSLEVSMKVWYCQMLTDN